ncbi:MAG TPA: ABC transporter ATP-binding protein [Coriobacteriia bacterium]
MSDIAVRTSALTRDFPSVRAVDGLSLEVPRGIVFGFLGPNGSGKTTTVRLLLGLLEPTAGSAEVLGFDVVHEPAEVRRRCGALMEHNGLYERLTAEENLRFFADVWHVPRAERDVRIRELLEHLGLWERRQDVVGGWSRGMKQKLAVARTLLHRPQVVFLDEPTAGLDPVAGAALRDDLASLVAEDGATVFINTHHLDEAERLCARVGVIREGRLLAVGHPDELRARHGGGRLEIVGSGFGGEMLSALRLRPEVASATVANGRLTIELTAEGEVPPLVAAVVELGGRIEEVRRGAESLEDAFLALLTEAGTDAA